MHDQLRAAGQRLVGDRIHVADDHVRLVAGFEEGVRTPVHSDEDRLEVTDVRTDRPQVALVSRVAGDDQGVAVTERRPELGQLHALGQELALLAQEAQRVVGEVFERFGEEPAPLEPRQLPQRVLHLLNGDHSVCVTEEGMDHEVGLRLRPDPRAEIPGAR